jgi:DNA anti-recombination protein RmuC
MDAETKQALEAMEGRIAKRFDQIDERIHDTETKLLKAFYDWARPVDSRIGKTLPALDERLGWVEQRLAELERKNLERGL